MNADGLSPAPTSLSPRADQPLLALDSASRRVSVAIWRPDGAILAAEESTGRHGSERLLQLIDEVLRDSGLALTGLGGLLALRGPGSFTGLRIGMATVLGLHEATGLPATAISTLRVLGHTGRAASEAAGRPVTAVVDALRGEWFTQIFGPQAAGVARCLSLEELVAADCAVIVGADLEPLRAHRGWASPPLYIEVPTLASHALSLATSEPVTWDAARLLTPLYLRGPSAVPQKPAAEGGPSA